MASRLGGQPRRPPGPLAVGHARAAPRLAGGDDPTRVAIGGAAAGEACATSERSIHSGVRQLDLSAALTCITVSMFFPSLLVEWPAGSHLDSAPTQGPLRNLTPSSPLEGEPGWAATCSGSFDPLRRMAAAYCAISPEQPFSGTVVVYSVATEPLRCWESDRGEPHDRSRVELRGCAGCRVPKGFSLWCPFSERSEFGVAWGADGSIRILSLLGR